jgi:type IX secretion system substrate protein
MYPRDCSYPLKMGLALCLGILIHTACLGQCDSNLSTRTFDTTLTGNGFQTFKLSFPQWDPDSGLLVSVKLSAQVSSMYGFTLTNEGAASSAYPYSLTIGQEDVISGSALSSPYTGLTYQNIGSWSLSPDQSVTYAPFVFLNDHITSDSITSAVTPFLGTSQVNLSYMSFTYTDLTAENNSTYQYTDNISNAMKFSVQYLFCQSGGVLATNLTAWSAQLVNPGQVRLSWTDAVAVAGRQYGIQRSTDGQIFTTITTITAEPGSASNDYSYMDRLPEGVSGTLYYRLQLIDAGQTSLSPVRTVTIPREDHTLRVYPNPATSYLDLTTGQPPGDWLIEIFSAAGNLVQKQLALQSSNIHISLNINISSGVYFIRATDLRGQRNYTASFVRIPQ